MAVNISKIIPTTGYYSGASKTATITFSDSNPLYENLGGGNYFYAMTFNLYGASSGGTPLGAIGYYSTTLTSQPSPISASPDILLTMPSGLTTNTYYVGAVSGGIRKTINVTEAQVTLTFYLNGGVGTPLSPIIQGIGSSFNMPGTSGFYRTGYSAVNWNTNSSGTGTAYNFNSSYVFTINTDLYVKWQINQYTISFNSNGGTSILPITQNYQTLLPTLTTPTKAGYTFGGWYEDSSLTIPNPYSYMPASNITLYAKWTVNNYTVTFNSNGGTSVSSITQAYNSTVNKPTDPTLTGYTFNGWYYIYNASYVLQTWPFTMPINGKSLYALWNINYYNADFYNGTDLIEHNYLSYGTTINEPSRIPIKLSDTKRYVFLGWNTNSNATEALTNLGSIGTSDITFYAIFKEYYSALKINEKDVNLKIGTSAGDAQVKKIIKDGITIWEDYHE